MKIVGIKAFLNQFHYLFNKQSYFLNRLKNRSQLELHKEFVVACYQGKLDLVQYLLLNKDLDKKIDIHYRNDEGFRWACQNGHMEIVRLLLTDNKLINHSNVHANKDEGIMWCCLNGHLDLLKYLLTNSELKEHGNIYNALIGLKVALNNGHLEILKYIFNEYKLIMTKELCVLFEEEPRLKQFNELYQLYDKLNVELTIN